MAKTWYGHHIENIKGEDYVLFKDYLELDKEIERLNKIINELEKDIKEDNQKAREYMKKVEQSGMCQGDYPVHYYYADKRIGLTEKYLERLKELKEGK